jgi:hypothetical protein
MGWGANQGSFGFRLFYHHSSTEPRCLLKLALFISEAPKVTQYEKILVWL